MSPSNILLTSTTRWARSARLLIEFSRASDTVSIVCPTYEPSRKVQTVHNAFRYKPFATLASLADAIEATKPDIIVPCDDRAVLHLHQLYSSERARYAKVDIPSLIVRSLGPPESHATVVSRYSLLKVAREEKIRTPDTKVICNAEDLNQWHSAQRFPWVLKIDGTTGGNGVKIAHTLPEARSHFAYLRRSIRFMPFARRLVAERDPYLMGQWWHGVRSVQPAIVAQSFIHGRPANCAVVCWKGEVLAGVGCEVVSTEWSLGPANVIRLVDNADMMDAAGMIARRLGLSGFFGLDFVIEEETGAAYLIEMNPRCTPLCHLRLGNGRDMIGAISAQLAGKPLGEQVSITQNNLIAYFPGALLSNSEFLSSSYHDVPEGESELIQEILRAALLRPNRGLRAVRATRSLLHAIFVRGRRAPVGRADVSR